MLLFREFNRGMLDACCDALLSLMLCEQVMSLIMIHLSPATYGVTSGTGCAPLAHARRTGSSLLLSSLELSDTQVYEP